MSGAWELLAPSYGGTVADLVVAAERLVYAATSVGVYRSSDGGESWTLPGTAPTVPFAAALAASPRFATDRILFACGSDGLYRSSDAGDSWQRVLVGGRMFSVVSAVTADGLTVLTATEDDGVLRSEDGGKSWTGANAGLLDLTVLSLALSPCFDTDHTAFAGTASGLYRTRNGGRSWRAVEPGVEDPAVQCVAVSPDFAADRMVVAGTEADGLLRSRDGGSTWQALGFAGVSALAFRDGQNIAAATEHGVATSSDAGETWRIMEDSASAPALSLVFDGDSLLAGLHRGGVVRSWHVSNSGLSARLDTSLVISADSRMFISGLEEGVRVSSDGGFTWAEYNTGLDELSIHSLAASATTIWAATAGGLFASDDRKWVRCLGLEGRARVVAASSHVVVAGCDGAGLARSEDEGVSWHLLATPWLEAEIVALAVARDATLFAATVASDEVTLWRTVDAGETWRRWLVQRAAGTSRIALSATDADSAWVGLGARVLSPLRNTREVRGGEQRPIWRSANLGPDVVGITSLAVRDGGVYAATNAGVFFSRDRGASFTDWSSGLESRRMVALAVSPEFVYGLGLGGSVFRRGFE